MKTTFFFFQHECVFFSPPFAGRQAACLLLRGHVDQAVGLPDVRVPQDPAGARPQRQQRRLRPLRRPHRIVQQGQVHQGLEIFFLKKYC